MANTTELDQNQAIKESFDEAEKALRVINRNSAVPVVWTSYMITRNSIGDISSIEYFNGAISVLIRNYYYDTNGDLLGSDKV
jgi:hypothetical protein